MKKIIIGVALALIGLIALACIVISLQPNTFSVERTATMAAPPAAVFAEINDLRAWDHWSPWIKLDPNAKTTFSDPSAGKDATIDWNGNDQVGEGRLTIVDSRPDEHVVVEQVFVRPMAGKAYLSFVFEPEEQGTKVIWHMEGVNNFLGKAVCMFMNMDAMLGKDFETGLANLKQVVEKSSVEKTTTGQEPAASDAPPEGAAAP